MFSQELSESQAIKQPVLMVLLQTRTHVRTHTHTHSLVVRVNCALKDHHVNRAHTLITHISVTIYLFIYLKTGTAIKAARFVPPQN